MKSSRCRSAAQPLLSARGRGVAISWFFAGYLVLALLYFPYTYMQEFLRTPIPLTVLYYLGQFLSLLLYMLPLAFGIVQLTRWGYRRAIPSVATGAGGYLFLILATFVLDLTVGGYSAAGAGANLVSAAVQLLVFYLALPMLLFLAVRYLYGADDRQEEAAFPSPLSLTEPRVFGCLLCIALYFIYKTVSLTIDVVDFTRELHENYSAPTQTEVMSIAVNYVFLIVSHLLVYAAMVLLPAFLQRRYAPQQSPEVTCPDESHG